MRLMKEATSAWQGESKKRPSILYHYSRATGLSGILESACLWATDSRFTNDPSEMSYACRIARETVEKGYRRPLKLIPEVREYILDEINQYEADARVYIACFCARGDLLSQWRGYGADGGGYSLGFDAGSMRAFEKAYKPYAVLRRVLYNPDAQRRWFDRWLRILNEACLQGDKNAASRRTEDAVWWKYMMFFSEWINCVKEPAYREEEEWRLIAFGRVNRIVVHKPSFRATSCHVVPYVRLGVGRQKRLPLREIRFGPTLEPKLTERSIRLLLEHHGYKKVGIKSSKVPYRG